jgi:two-component system, LytTR family, sensor kinase
MASNAESAVTLPRADSIAAFAIAWVIFWLSLAFVEVQDYRRGGGAELWKPLLWTGSSMLVATVITWLQWRRLTCIDHLLATPRRWFAASLKWLPLAAPLFVVAIYAIRHAAYAALGRTYTHEPWTTVFIYEIVKFSSFYLMFAALIFGIRSHAALNQAQLRLERERRLTQHAQLLQLAQQIEPHFLFNALNTIAETIHSDPQLADTLLTQLATLLRAATDLARKPEASLQDELNLIRAYSAIMQQRFCDRVTIAFDIDPNALACRLPTLLLQPLLENAIRHGVEKHSQPTAIAIRAKLTDAGLHIEVQDNTGELPPQRVYGIGLTNLQQRLQTRYGERAQLTLTQAKGGGVTASIALPCGF